MDSLIENLDAVSLPETLVSRAFAGLEFGEMPTTADIPSYPTVHEKIFRRCRDARKIGYAINGQAAHYSDLPLSSDDKRKDLSGSDAWKKAARSRTHLRASRTGDAPQPVTIGAQSPAVCLRASRRGHVLVKSTDLKLKGHVF